MRAKASPERIGGLALDWMAGCALVYAALFGMGTLLLDSAVASLPYFGVAALAAAFIYRDLSRRGWGSVTG